MQTITTQSTRERLIRNSLVTAMLLGFSAYSFYDGYSGYPQDNLKAMVGEVPAEYQAEAQINPRVQSKKLPPIARGDRLSEVEEKLGAAAWKGKGAENFNKAVWFGPGGMLILRYGQTGVVTDIFWKPAKHSEMDLVIQKGMGIVTGIIGLIFLVRVLGMLFTRVRLSDEGLTPARGGLIAWDDMTGWDPADYKDKGRIHLTYTRDGAERVYVLDDYKLAAFREMVIEICARKGFRNPLDDRNAPEVGGNPAS